MVYNSRVEYEIKNTLEYYPNFKYKLIKKSNYNIHAWFGKIKIGKRKIYLYIRFGESFPNTRPLVSIVGEGFNNKELNTSHKDDCNNICLYTSDGSINSWDKNYTIVDVIDRTKLFLDNYYKGKDRDIHKAVENIFIDLTNEKKFIINSNWFPKNQAETGYIIFQKNINNDNFYYAVTITDLYDNILDEINNPYFRKNSKNIEVKKVRWIYLKREHIKNIFNIKNKKKFNEYMNRKQSLKNLFKEENNEYIIFTGVDKKKLYIQLDKKNYFSNVISIDKNMFFARNKGIIDVEKISSKKVTIFGVGSLGSKVTEMLSRTGLENFNIIDYDQFCPENLSRHVLSTNELFLNKATALKERLLSINPFSNVKDFSFNLFNYDEIYLGLKSLIANSDLVICCTGDEESEYYLNNIMIDVSKEKKIPCIYCGILGNGFGGRLHKVIAGDTPCYECIKIQQNNYPETYKLYNEDIFFETNDYDLGIYTEPGIPGLDVDINMFACIIIKMCLEILLENKNKYFKYNSYLWGNKTGWIFEQPFMLKDIRFNKVSNCPTCGAIL